MLEIDRLDAFHGDFQALFALGMRVEAGGVVALIGANGAGKSTLLKSIAGLVRARPDAIRLKGVSIGGLPAHEIVRLGVALVPEGRRLFRSLSVEENLKLAGSIARKGHWNLKRVYELFPVLAEKRDTPATLLSGGQQQMVAMARGLMTNPDLMLCDEISLGLAPIVVRDIYARLPHIRREGATIILVEQDISQALAVATRVYCLQEGRVSLEGAPGTLTRAAIARAYFGV